MPEGFSIIEKINEADFGQVLRLFLLRTHLWKGEALSEAEQQFWDATYSRAANWAVFRRLQISDDDKRAQVFGEQLADELEAALCAAADELR